MTSKVHIKHQFKRICATQPRSFLSLESVLLLEDLVLLVQGVHTVNHLLHQLHLRVSKPVLVGDVVSDTSLSTRFSPGSTGLKMKFFTSCLENLQSFLGVSREVNVDRCSHTSSQVGWAGVDITILGVKHEVLSRLSFNWISNSLDATGKTIKNTSDISSTLHGDDPELIFLIDPGEEGLVLVVEDAAALWPVSLHTSNLEVRISRNKKEVIIDQLLANLLVHARKWIVGTSKVTGQVSKCLGHKFFNSNSLFLGDARGKSKAINGSSNSDTGGVNWSGRINVSFDLSNIHVTCVDSISSNAMVLLDQGVKHISKHLIGVPIPGINATMLIVKLHSTSNGLGQGETTGLSLEAAQLVPDWLGHILGDQGLF